MSCNSITIQSTDLDQRKLRECILNHESKRFSSSVPYSRLHSYSSLSFHFFPLISAGNNHQFCMPFKLIVVLELIEYAYPCLLPLKQLHLLLALKACCGFAVYIMYIEQSHYKCLLLYCSCPYCFTYLLFLFNQL